MKWCRYSYQGETSFGLVEGETVREIEGVPWGQHTVTGPAVPLTDVKLEIPTVPSTFFCVGVNYRDHVERMAAKRGTKPSYPPRPDIGEPARKIPICSRPLNQVPSGGIVNAASSLSISTTVSTSHRSQASTYRSTIS